MLDMQVTVSLDLFDINYMALYYVQTGIYACSDWSKTPVLLAYKT